MRLFVVLVFLLSSSSWATLGTAPLKTSTVDSNAVRELVDENNHVYATCWKGPTPPKSLSTLFGDHYKDLYLKALSEAPRRKGQRVLVVRTSEIGIRSGRHRRGFYGCVYDPNLIPGGVQENEIN